MIYRRLVNQHLSSARLLLAELTRQESANHSLQRAFEDSALHLLNSAYLCQLRAIAESYHCGNIFAITDIQTLLAALIVIDNPAPEAAEIEILVNEGWLAELLTAQQKLSLPEPLKTNDPVQRVVSQSEINLCDTSREEPTISVDTLRDWMAYLEELVQRHSEMMEEY